MRRSSQRVDGRPKSIRGSIGINGTRVPRDVHRAASSGRSVRLARHHLVVRLMQSTIDLFVVAEQLQGTELERMSDEELETAHLRNITEMVHAHPEIAIHAARRLGWTLVPPTEADSSARTKATNDPGTSEQST